MAELRLPTLNFVILTGRLVQDPELRFTPSGKAVSRLRMASSRPYKDPSGNWQEDTLFIDITAWGDLAERVSRRLTRGSPIMVQGRLRSRTWESETGQKRTAYEIVAFSIQSLEKIGAEPPEVTPSEEPALEEGVPEDEDLPF